MSQVRLLRFALLLSTATIAFFLVATNCSFAQTPPVPATSLSAVDNGSPLWMRYPAISPDGRTIAFAYRGHLFTVPSAGGAATPLTAGPAHDFQPVWSPDGQTIAFASNAYGNFDVYVVPSAGGPHGG